MEKLREKQRKMMMKSVESARKTRIVRIKEEKERYSKTSTKDFVKWHLDWFNQKGALEIDYTPSDKIKMFFNEFSSL